MFRASSRWARRLLWVCFSGWSFLFCLIIGLALALACGPGSRLAGGAWLAAAAARSGTGGLQGNADIGGTVSRRGGTATMLPVDVHCARWRWQLGRGRHDDRVGRPGSCFAVVGDVSGQACSPRTWLLALQSTMVWLRRCRGRHIAAAFVGAAIWCTAWSRRCDARSWQCERHNCSCRRVV